jgi:NADH-quinone oxidoreductase subunit J
MSIYFFITSPIIIISCLLIVTSKNSITSILYLILVFVLNSISFLLLGAEFLSILIIIIYIGAISILFLFVIMMLNLRIVEVYNTLVTYFPIASFLSIIFIFEFFYLLKNDIKFIFPYDANNQVYSIINTFDLVISNSNLYLIGDLLFNSYSHLLVIVGLILLLAMIGSIILTIDIQYHYIKNKKFLNYNKTRMPKNCVSF